TFGDGRALVSAAVELKPDVIVLDVAMPILNGLDAGRQTKKKMPSVKLVYLTMNPDAEVAAAAFTLGASGYLLKTSAASELPAAIREALCGRTYLSKKLWRATIDALCWEQKNVVSVDEPLTDRQREVLQLLAEGKVVKEVASILHMSHRTVNYHKYHMMKKLGVKHTSDLVK